MSAASVGASARLDQAARAPETRQVLVLTDRYNEGLAFQRLLGLTSCLVLALNQALTLVVRASVIVCDIALDNVASSEQLRAALVHHRAGASVPILCLTRDPSELTMTQARAIGAAAILPYNTPKAHLLSVLKQLTEAAPPRPTAAPLDDRSREIRGNIQEAGTALAALYTAARHRQPLSTAVLARGGNAVLAAVREARIRVWLDVVWSFDDVTYQHCLLVAGLVASFSIKVGLSLRHQRILSQAALIHDIGKANIPTVILMKPGKLLPSEMLIMRTHAAIGYDMLVGQAGHDPLLLDIVRHHHEYLDGSGYPDGLRGAQLSQFVRMVTICDIYAAMIERRPYKVPLSAEVAYAHLVEMGAKLDASLLAPFLAVITGEA